MPDMEVDFPRGGELAAASEQTKTKGAKKRKADETEDGPKAKKEVDSEHEGVFLRRLVKDLLTEDVRGLGIVKEIKETELILDGANGVNVLVPAKNISKDFVKVFGQVEMKDVFQLGQAVAFKVLTKAKGKKDLPIVSIDPDVVNGHLVPAALKNALVVNGSIKSIEDKGAVVDIGMGKITGFVQESDVPDHFKPLKVGQVLLFRVRKSSEKQERVLQLSAFAEADTYSNVVDRNQLMPGTTISAEPSKVVSTGMFVKLGEDQHGFVHMTSLPPRIRLDPERLGKQIRVIVTSILPNSALFTLSAHPDIIAVSNPQKRLLSEDKKIGETVSATVYNVDSLGNVHFYLGDDKSKPDFITAKSMPQNFEKYESDISKFEPDTTHKLKVIGYQWAERTIILSNKKVLKKQKLFDQKDAVPGRRIVGFVKDIKPTGLTVRFGSGDSQVLGKVLEKHVMDNRKRNWTESFQVNQRINCRVLYYDEATNRLYLTSKASLVNSNLPVIDQFDEKFVNEYAVGQLIQRFASGAYLVSFFNKTCGFLPSADAKRDTTLLIGDTVKVRIVNIDGEKHRMLLSLAEEGDQAPEEEVSKFTLQKVTKPAKPFRIYDATVIGPWTLGKTSKFTTAELRLPGGTIGRLHVSELELSDEEVKDGHSAMRAFLNKNQGKQVRVKVICVGIRTWVNSNAKDILVKKCGSTRFVECTAKKVKIDEPYRKLRLIAYQSAFDRGDKVRAFVGEATKCEKDGYIVAEINPFFQAHIPQAYVDKKILEFDSENPKTKKSKKEKDQLVKRSAAFSLDDGQVINGLVIALGKTQRSRFVQIAWGDDILKTEESPAKKRTRNASNISANSNIVEDSDEDEEVDVEGEDEEVEGEWSVGEFSMENLAKVGKRKNETEEEMEVDQNTTVEEEEEEASDGEPEEEKELSQNVSKKAKAASLKEVVSESPADFDRLLTASPNSSELWIKYMTFFASKDQLQEARNIIERAFDVVSHREQEELFNIWTAYLNFEVIYGTEESLKKVFERAAASMDSLKMHKQLAEIYEHHGKAEELVELYDTMLKKFRHEDLELWFNYANYLYQNEQAEKARILMKRALDSLNKKHHVSIMSRFAQLEYKHGDPEKGKTVLEKVLTTYPKKTDIWNVYVDLSIKYEGIHEARRILERISKMSLPLVKKRTLLNKWITLEQTQGSEDALNHCRQVISEVLGENSDEEEE